MVGMPWRPKENTDRDEPAMTLSHSFDRRVLSDADLRRPSVQ